MEEISPTKQNILQYLDYKGISKADFCRQTGFSYENFKGKSLKSDIGGAILGKIITIFSDISPEWLLTGEGSMIKGETQSDSNKAAIETLLDRIEKQREEITLLKLELEHYRSTDAATATP
ncbi:MAG: hypothetical protein K5685_05080 [Bacteroidales bacterium]|nr:hypothetical protein [Bacteroidales bacterium]